MKVHVPPVTRTDLENAALPTLGVTVGLLLAQFPVFHPVAGFLVVVMQCMMSVRVKGTPTQRLQMLAYVWLILIGTVAWGIVGAWHMVNAAVGVILLSLALTYWRHFFPDDWRNINAPASAIYFFTLALKPGLTALYGVALCGLVGIALQTIMWKAWPSAFAPQSALVRLKSRRVRKRKLPVDLELVTNLKTDLWRYNLRLTILLIISIFIVNRVHAMHAYWIPLTVIIVLQDNHADTLKRVGGRILGTFIGCIIGSAILTLHPQPVISMPLLILCLFTFLLIVKHNYPVACIFLTVYIVLLIGRSSTNSFVVAFERTAYTLMGGLLVLMSSWLLFWRRKKA
jgi:hypothetical protein